MILRNSNEDGYIENTPEVEVEAASSSCCWRLWGSLVVEVFFLIAMGEMQTARSYQTKYFLIKPNSDNS